jgi:transcriptional regulator with XRE-family HTH domain
MSVPTTKVTPIWTFADRLRKARLLTGMDQRAFAAALGVTASALAAWEADRAHPRDIVDLAKRIEEVTGIDPAWMLGLTDTPPGPSNVRNKGQQTGSRRKPAKQTGKPDDWFVSEPIRPAPMAVLKSAA